MIHIKYEDLTLFEQARKMSLQNLMKRTETKNFLVHLASLARKMHDQDVSLIRVRVDNSAIQPIVAIWDIHYLAYYAIKHRDWVDHRYKYLGRNLDCTLVSAANKHQNRNYLSDNKEVLPYITGLFLEQSLFQKANLINSSIHRTNYILTRTNGLDINNILNSSVNCDLGEYWRAIIFIYLVCKNEESPFKNYYGSEREKGLIEMNPMFGFNRLKPIIAEISCSYKEVAKSQLKYQIFYEKPLINIDNSYVCINPQLVMFLFNSLLYRLCFKHCYHFSNIFGNMFESYVGEVIGSSACSFKKINHDGKRADFVVWIGNTTILVEVKTALLEIGIKSYYPDLSRYYTYIEKIVAKAYKQIKASIKKEFTLKEQSNVLKIILAYDESSVYTDIKKVVASVSHLPKIFNNDETPRILDEFINDDHAIFATIGEFETLMAISEDQKVFDSVIEALLSNNCNCQLVSIFAQLNIEYTPYLGIDNNFLNELLKNMINKV